MKPSLFRLCTVCAVAALSNLSPAHGDQTEELEPVVVTASRVPTPRSEVAQSITVIEPTESDRQSGRPIFEILRSVPGVSVMNSGGAGRLTEVYVRGSGYQQTLVMIDGVAMNDPSSPGRGYDFGRLTARQVDRIEVLGGSQSGVHGANAIGGVINIITRRQRGDSASIFAEYGSFDTRRGSLIASRSIPSGTVNLNLGYDESDGFPSASPLAGNSINSGSGTFSGTLTTEAKLSDSWRLQTTARGHRARTELPFSGGANGDDPNHVQLETQGTAKAELSYQGHASWEPSASISYFKTYRRTDNEPDLVHADAASGRYHGARIRLEQLNSLLLDDANTLSFGVDTQVERSSIFEKYGAVPNEMPSVSQSVSGIFFEERWKSASSFASLALRGDRFHGFGDQLTYRAGLGRRFESERTLLKGSIGRGFKVPSLDQLHAPDYGNGSLAPETSLSYEVSLQREVRPRFVLETSWFHSSFSNLIVGDPLDSYRYRNIGSATTQGLDTSVSYRSGHGDSVLLTHSFLIARNNDKNEDLDRRPRQSVNLSLRKRARENLELGLTGRYVGARNDKEPATSVAIRMPAYTLVHADASYVIGSGYKAFGRVDNVLDRKYEEVAGYGTARRSLHLGLQKDF